jgi:hypothetical protein
MTIGHGFDVISIDSSDDECYVCRGYFITCVQRMAREGRNMFEVTAARILRVIRSDKDVMHFFKTSAHALSSVRGT